MTLELALQILRLLIDNVPELARSLRDIFDGKSNPGTTRVKDILPEESETEKALRELGG